MWEKGGKHALKLRPRLAAGTADAAAGVTAEVTRLAEFSLASHQTHSQTMQQLVAPGITTNNKKLLVTKGIATRSKAMHQVSKKILWYFMPLHGPCSCFFCHLYRLQVRGWQQQH